MTSIIDKKVFINTVKEKTDSNGLDTNTEECKALLESDYKDIINILIDNTLYLTLDEVTNSLKNQISIFNENRDKTMPIVVLINADKIGSEQYFYYILQSYLPPHYILFGNKLLKKIKKPTYLLLLDDWCLSGQNAITTYYNVLFEEYNNNNFISLVLITAIITDKAINLLKLFKNINIYAQYKINDFEYYLGKNLDEYKSSHTEEEYSIYYKQVTKYLTPFFNKFSPVNRSHVFPVHLEYKISNNFGSFTQINNDCRTNKPDKSFMKDSKEIFEKNSAINSTEYNAPPPLPETTKCEKNSCIISGGKIKSKKKSKRKSKRKTKRKSKLKNIY